MASLCGSCYTAMGFVSASLGIAMFSSKHKKEFVSLLNPDQRLIFGQITHRRSMIYVLSMVFGAGVAFAVLKGSPMCGVAGTCVSVTVMMGVSYISYLLWPKGRYMLDYLTGRDQVQAWLRMYRHMIKLYHVGFLFGVIGYALVAWSQAHALAAAEPA